MTTTTKAPVRIARASFKDFKSLELFELAPHGKPFTVSGPNGAGKTSVAEGLLLALGVLKPGDVKEPVRHGAESGGVDVDLTDGTRIRRTLGARGAEWTITAPDGSSLKPSVDLERLISKRGTNPTAFLGLKPREQIDALLSAAGVVPPAAEVAEITGEGLPPHEGESAAAYLDRLSADGSGVYFVRRLEAGRVAKAKRAAHDDAAATLARLPALEESASVERLLETRRGLEEKQRAREKAKGEAVRLRNELAAGKNTLDLLKSQSGNLQDEIRDLERRLEAKRQEYTALRERRDKGAAAIEVFEARVSAAESHAAGLPDPGPHLAECDRAIADAQKQQAKHAERAALAARAKDLRRDAEAADQAHAAAGTALGALRDLRQNLLNGVDLGVEGLAIDDGELRFQGTLLSECSQGERYTVACAVAARQNPDARIMVLDRAESLDAVHEKIVLELAERHGWQCVLLVTTRGGALGWKVVDA